MHRLPFASYLRWSLQCYVSQADKRLMNHMPGEQKQQETLWNGFPVHGLAFHYPPANVNNRCGQFVHWHRKKRLLHLHRQTNN